jgi:hypothetical protein
VWTALEKCGDFAAFEQEVTSLVDEFLLRLGEGVLDEGSSCRGLAEERSQTKEIPEGLLHKQRADLLHRLSEIEPAFLVRDSSVAERFRKQSPNRVRELEVQTFTSIESIIGEELVFRQAGKKMFVSEGQLSAYFNSNLTFRLETNELVDHKLICMSQFYQRGYLCCAQALFHPARIQKSKPSRFRPQEARRSPSGSLSRSPKQDRVLSGFNKFRAVKEDRATLRQVRGCREEGQELHQERAGGDPRDSQDRKNSKEANFPAKPAAHLLPYSIGELDLETMEYHRLFEVDHKVSNILVAGESFVLFGADRRCLTFTTSTGMVEHELKCPELSLNEPWASEEPQGAEFMGDVEDYEMGRIALRRPGQVHEGGFEETWCAVLKAAGSLYIQTASRKTQSPQGEKNYDLLKIDTSNDYTLEKVFLPSPFRSGCQFGSNLLLICRAGSVILVDGKTGKIERELEHPRPACLPQLRPVHDQSRVSEYDLQPGLQPLREACIYEKIYSDGDMIFTFMQYFPATSQTLNPHMAMAQSLQPRKKLVLSLLTLGKDGLECSASISLQHMQPDATVLGCVSIREIRHLLLTDSNGADLYVICTEHKTLRMVKVFRMSDKEVIQLLEDRERLLTEHNNPANTLVLAGKDLTRLYQIKFKIV